MDMESPIVPLVIDKCTSPKLTQLKVSIDDMERGYISELVSEEETKAVFKA